MSKQNTQKEDRARCVHCGISTVRKSMRRHMKSVHGPKRHCPYEETGCKWRCADGRNYLKTNHVRKNHLEHMEDVIRQKIEGSVESPASGIQPPSAHVCPIFNEEEEMHIQNSPAWFQRNPPTPPVVDSQQPHDILSAQIGNYKLGGSDWSLFGFMSPVDLHSLHGYYHQEESEHPIQHPTMNSSWKAFSNSPDTDILSETFQSDNNPSSPTYTHSLSDASLLYDFGSSPHINNENNTSDKKHNILLDNNLHTYEHMDQE